MNPLHLGSGRALFFGTYRIENTISRLGVPGSYPVTLYERTSGLLVDRTISADDGTYVFQNLANLAYFAVGFDDTDTPVNAAVADLITPVAMP